MQFSHLVRDYLLLHLVILAWGFTAILGKLIALPPLDVVRWRTALAAIGFGAVARWRGRSLHVPMVEAWKMLIVGGILGLHWLMFFASARLATASISLAALPTIMLWCSLIEPWVDGTRRWRPLELLVGLVIVGAVWLIYEVELRFWLGFSVGLGAALLAAIFAVVNKQLVTQWHFSVMGFYQMAGAFGACALGWPFFGGSSSMPSATDLLWLLVLSSVCTVGAYAGYMHVLRRLSVFAVNVVYNLEPIYGMVLAALVFGSQEIMSGGFYAGAAVIVGCVVALPWLRRYVEGA